MIFILVAGTLLNSKIAGQWHVHAATHNKWLECIVMPQLGLISASAPCVCVNNPACSTTLGTTDLSCVCNNTIWALLNFKFEP